MNQDLGLSAVAAVVPAIAAPLQRVLELERGLLRPDPQRRPAGGLEQKREHRRTGRRQYEVQDLQQCVAVIEGAVGLVEEAGPVQQIAELRACEAVLTPADFGRAAAPCQSALDWDPPIGIQKDPFDRRVLLVALVSSELVGIAEARRARVI